MSFPLRCNKRAKGRDRIITEGNTASSCAFSSTLGRFSVEFGAETDYVLFLHTGFLPLPLTHPSVLDGIIQSLSVVDIYPGLAYKDRF